MIQCSKFAPSAAQFGEEFRLDSEPEAVRSLRPVVPAIFQFQAPSFSKISDEYENMDGLAHLSSRLEFPSSERVLRRPQYIAFSGQPTYRKVMRFVGTSVALI